MDEREKQHRRAEAQRLQKDTFLDTILSEIEEDAMKRIISAEPHDDQTRASYAAEVRAIRNVRLKLRNISSISDTNEDNTVV